MADDDADELFRRAAHALRAPRHGSPAALRRILHALDEEPGPQRMPSQGQARWSSALPITRLAAGVIFAIGLALGAGAGWGIRRTEQKDSFTRTNHRSSVSQQEEPYAVAARDVPDTTLPEAPRLVQFTLSASHAQHVSLVGEFNAWDATATPMRRGKNGEWQVELRLRPGRHIYAFLVDSRDWVTDPNAPLSPERWYGARNSVMMVNREATQ